MDRDLVLVTGGNSGIGLQCAFQLAREGRRVLIASRDRKASARAVHAIEAECGAGAACERGLDLGSHQAVRSFAQDIADEPVSSVVCNAGLQMNDGPHLTTDGFEITFGVNHLGHFLLVNLLLAKLAERAPARILVMETSSLLQGELRRSQGRGALGGECRDDEPAPSRIAASRVTRRAAGCPGCGPTSRAQPGSRRASHRK